MTADRASTKDQAAESALARYARAVAQPGGMNIDWPKVSAAGDIIVGLTAIYGLKYRKWRYVHTFGVALGFAAVAAGFLKSRYGEVPRAGVPPAAAGGEPRTRAWNRVQPHSARQA